MLTNCSIKCLLHRIRQALTSDDRHQALKVVDRTRKITTYSPSARLNASMEILKTNWAMKLKVLNMSLTQDTKDRVENIVLVSL